MVERIKQLCGAKYMTLNKLVQELGLSQGSISNWDKNSPSIDKVQKVADYFNVSLDYLAGRTDSHTSVQSNFDNRQIQMLKLRISELEVQLEIAKHANKILIDVPLDNAEVLDSDIKHDF